MLPRPLLPKPDRRFSRIRLSGSWSVDGLAQALDSGHSEESHQPLGRRRLAHPNGAVHCRVPVRSPARFTGTFGRKALRHYPNPCERGPDSFPTPRSYVPSLHGHYPLLRYYGRSDPGRPLTAADRGSQVHVTRTADHSISNHRRGSTSRFHCTPRWSHYFVRASPLDSQARQPPPTESSSP